MMDISKYTPIKDRFTGEPIFLGDMVEGEKGYCGFLDWDDYLNQYVIRTEGEYPSRFKTMSYKKIEKLHENNIDTSSVECRRNHLKQKW